MTNFKTTEHERETQESSTYKVSKPFILQNTQNYMNGLEENDGQIYSMSSQVDQSEQYKQNQNYKSFASQRYNFRQILSPQEENIGLDQNNEQNLNKAKIIKVFENLNQFSCQQSQIQHNTSNSHTMQKCPNDNSIQLNLESKYLKEQMTSGIQTPNDLEKTDSTQIAHILSQVNNQYNYSREQNLFQKEITKGEARNLSNLENQITNYEINQQQQYQQQTQKIGSSTPKQFQQQYLNQWMNQQQNSTAQQQQQYFNVNGHHNQAYQQQQQPIPCQDNLIHSNDTNNYKEKITREEQERIERHRQFSFSEQKRRQSHDQQQLNLFAQSIDKNPLPFNPNDSISNGNQDMQQDMVQIGSVLIHQDNKKFQQNQYESYNSLVKLTNHSSNQHLHQNTRSQLRLKDQVKEPIQVYQDPQQITINEVQGPPSNQYQTFSKRESVHHNDSITEKIKVLRDDIHVLFPTSKKQMRHENLSISKTYQQQNLPIKGSINTNKLFNKDCSEIWQEQKSFLQKSRSQERPESNCNQQRNSKTARTLQYQQYKNNVPTVAEDLKYQPIEFTKDDLTSTQQFRSRSKELLKSEKQQQNMISLTARIEENKLKNQSLLDKNFRNKSIGTNNTKSKLKFLKTSGNLKLNNQLDRMVNSSQNTEIPNIVKPSNLNSNYNTNDIDFLKDEILKLSEQLQKEQINFKKFKDTYQKKRKREGEKYQQEVQVLKQELNQIEQKYTAEIKKIETKYREFKESKVNKYKIKLKELQEMYELQLNQQRQLNKTLDDQIKALNRKRISDGDQWDQRQIEKFKGEYDKKLQIVMDKYESIIKEIRSESRSSSKHKDQYDILKYQNSKLEKENFLLNSRINELQNAGQNLKYKNFLFSNKNQERVIEPQSFLEFDASQERRQTLNTQSSKIITNTQRGESSDKIQTKNIARRLAFEEIQNKINPQQNDKARAKDKSRNGILRAGLYTQQSTKELKNKYGGMHN